MTIEQWILDNGVGIGTLITLIVLVAKLSRWSGVVDTRITNLEGWLKSHTSDHGGSHNG